MVNGWAGVCFGEEEPASVEGRLETWLRGRSTSTTAALLLFWRDVRGRLDAAETRSRHQPVVPGITRLVAQGDNSEMDKK